MRRAVALALGSLSVVSKEIPIWRVTRSLNLTILPNRKVSVLKEDWHLRRRLVFFLLTWFESICPNHLLFSLTHCHRHLRTNPRIISVIAPMSDQRAVLLSRRREFCDGAAATN